MGLCAACCGDDVRALTLSRALATPDRPSKKLSVLGSIGMRYGPVCCLLCGDDVRALTLSSVGHTRQALKEAVSVSVNRYEVWTCVLPAVVMTCER